jgi:hypothetical protein
MDFLRAYSLRKAEAHPTRNAAASGGCERWKRRGAVDVHTEDAMVTAKLGTSGTLVRRAIILGTRATVPRCGGTWIRS